MAQEDEDPAVPSGNTEEVIKALLPNFGLPGPPSYRARFADAVPADQANNTSHDQPQQHFVTRAEARRRNKEAGGVPIHNVFTDPNTGFIEEQWSIKRPDGVTYPHREDGPAMTTFNPKTGVFVEESYWKYGAPTHGKDGFESIERDPNTGVTLSETRRVVGDSVRSFERDPKTGVVTYEDAEGLRNDKLIYSIDRDAATGTVTRETKRNSKGELVDVPVSSAPAGRAKISPIPGP